MQSRRQETWGFEHRAALDQETGTVLEAEQACVVVIASEVAHELALDEWAWVHAHIADHGSAA